MVKLTNFVVGLDILPAGFEVRIISAGAYLRVYAAENVRGEGVAHYDGILWVVTRYLRRARIEIFTARFIMPYILGNEDFFKVPRNAGARNSSRLNLRGAV